MWENLKKTPAMDVGQVSFHRDKDVRKIRVEKKINETVNRLNKTKTETFPGKMIITAYFAAFAVASFIFVFHCRFSWRT